MVARALVVIAEGNVKIIHKRNKSRKRRRRSVKEWLLSRSGLGANYTLLPQLRTDFPEDYKRRLRMDAESFNYILKVVTLKLR